MKRALELLNAFVLLCMFGVTVATVVFRSVLEIPASWSEDLAQATFILLVFIGAAAVMEDEGHIRIDTVVDRFGPVGRRVLRIVARLVMVPFLLLFGRGAWDNAVNNWEVTLGTVEWVRIGQIYGVLVLTTAVMLYYLLVNIVRDLRGTREEPTTLNSSI